MIIGTAGHIDHGKTSLLKALTGTDADRLPEEKARGITVDLGFAYQHFDDCPSISFLDVPGHEKLVHNMLAGAIGMDFVVLVVAADDGVMPQTREHLAVIDLIGVRHGVIALTKTDRVDQARIAEVKQQIHRLARGTSFADAPVMPCSAITGAGIAALRQHLVAAAHANVAQKIAGHFRLAVDRCFTLTGIGLVVTGTVYSGEVKVGDSLLHSPAGTEIRVRNIRAENRAADTAHVGQRCALNLTGRRFEKDNVARGDWILAPAIHAPTQRLDVHLRLLPEEARALKHWTPVHVHVGAVDVTGRVSLLDDAALEPGNAALAQLVLDADIGAVHGDRFVIRDQSASRTLGGGHVIDPAPPRRGARTPARRQYLGLMDQPDAGAALAALIEAFPSGIDLDAFGLARNLTAAESLNLRKHYAIVEVRTGTILIGIAASHWETLQAGLESQIAEYQRLHADSPGATIDEILRLQKDLQRRNLGRAAMLALVEAGRLKRYGQLLHLPGHEVRLTETEEARWLQIQAVLEAAGHDQPRLNDLAARLELPPEILAPLLAKLGHAGRLRRVSKAYFMLPHIVARLAGAARAAADSHAGKLLTVGNFREATKVSRHMVMPLMEFFDKAGFTRRVKDGRQIRPDTSLDAG